MSRSYLAPTSQRRGIRRSLGRPSPLSTAVNCSFLALHLLMHLRVLWHLAVAREIKSDLPYSAAYCFPLPLQTSLRRAEMPARGSGGIHWRGIHAISLALLPRRWICNLVRWAAHDGISRLPLPPAGLSSPEISRRNTAMVPEKELLSLPMKRRLWILMRAACGSYARMNRQCGRTWQREGSSWAQSLRLRPSE